jgi:hypothetical protein
MGGARFLSKAVKLRLEKKYCRTPLLAGPIFLGEAAKNGV